MTNSFQIVTPFTPHCLHPTFFHSVGTQKSVGITPPDSALLFVILSPVGPYYPDGFKPVALYGTTEFTRASPGGTFAYDLRSDHREGLIIYMLALGTGEFKLGANYAPSVYPQKKAAEVGYVQNLWLYGPEHYLTEVCCLLRFPTPSTLLFSSKILFVIPHAP